MGRNVFIITHNNINVINAKTKKMKSTRIQERENAITNRVNTVLGADNVSMKKAEILSGFFRTKDGLSWNEATQLLNDLIKLAENGKWVECYIKDAPLESDILFQTKAGIIHAGIRFMPTKRSNKPVYQDFKKNKIRQNVVRWRFICA